MSLDSAEVDSAEFGRLLCSCSIEACGTRKLLILLLLFGANRLKDAGETRTRRLRLVLRGNAWVVRTVDVFLLPLELLLLVDLLIETRLLLRLRQRLLIDMVLLLLLRRRCLLITRVMLRLAAYVGSGG